MSPIGRRDGELREVRECGNWNGSLYKKESRVYKTKCISDDLEWDERKGIIPERLRKWIRACRA